MAGTAVDRGNEGGGNMAIHIERTVNINAPPERVWAVMLDVERWPE